MLPEKIRFLFGDLPVWADPDDPDDRAALFAEAAGPDGEVLTPLAAALHEVVAAQITDDRPPQVWATANRLLQQGLDRAEVLAQLALAAGTMAKVAFRTDRPYDEAIYLAMLDGLPHPSMSEIAETILDIARTHQPIKADELDRLAAERLDIDLDDDFAGDLFDQVSDALLTDGPLEYLARDRVVHVVSLTEGIVLTHRLREDERASGRLDATFDLSGFRRRPVLHLDDGSDVEVSSDEGWTTTWNGPGGWLDAFAPGQLVAVTVDPAGTVELHSPETEPDLDQTLPANLRRIYDDEVADSGLPVPGEDLVLELLAEDRTAFESARLPLQELCAAAGLDRRGHEVAHEQSVWQAQDAMRRTHRLLDRFDDVDQARAALEACRAAEEAEADASALRAVMAELRDPAVLSEVTDELLGPYDDPDALEVVEAFAAALRAAAATPRQRAVAHWLSAVACERGGQPIVAEQHLHVAVDADPEWLPAVDRLAWYASDRGDTTTAVRLWRRLGIGPDENPDLAEVLQAGAASTPTPGRNEACWCGSGRKFKQCHLGRAQAVALGDRVGWICRKMVAYLERRGGRTAELITAMALVRAVDDTDASLVDALGDPLVIDVILHELGWADRFRADRGPLLPDDEQLLVASWALVDRTVYEIDDVRPGTGVSVRDLRTGDHFEVRERTFSQQAKPGWMVCGRAVPDGSTHQFIGGVFGVSPGTEGRVLDLLDGGDAEELLAYVAALHRPPSLQTREGEEMVGCQATIDVGDPGAARRFLDAADQYEADADGWVELHDLGDGERIVRANLRLTGTELAINTSSQPRMDRVLAVIAAALPDSRVTADTRRPFRSDDLPPEPPGAGLSPDPAVVEALMDQMEQRWMREKVPALGGITPREAAADPTRRQELERLLASFPSPEPGGGWFGLRPDRLRRHLGLDTD